ncbi:xylosyl- and glucuronyltransferase LARGE2s [Plutella xylostella]|uniref:xylosyl- and glucuronyltransferase LARGE2s n=1 Tax=Plutella xylostella TaxID=51655 RepID=UPI00203247EF|nr:xylosyl- and glucuronyltransferase LARGE2s [Plutella xylostella]
MTKKFMVIRAKIFSRWFLRPWLGIPVGIWIAVVTLVYYSWIYSISTTDHHMPPPVFKTPDKLAELQTLSPMWSNYQVPVIPDIVGTLCEKIHIALVCMGKCPPTITPLLKSLLHHRQNPIHFHFIVDTSSEHVLNTLMKTWDLPDVNYSCYNAQDHLFKVSWVPNKHYSGIYTLVKLLVPEILPASLPRVIMLDSDLTFLSDVAELWSMFRNMTDRQFIGLVENESDWYFGQHRWPALGQGYNTGVMLLDLSKVRETVDWNTLWHEAINDNLAELQQLNLADQDVINVLIKNDPSILYPISCQYNIQMSTRSVAKSCYGENIHNVKVIHWNSNKKQNIEIRDAEYFKTLHLFYVNLDGNLLRNKLHKCYTTEVVTPEETKPNDLCASFHSAQRVKLRTLLYYTEYQYTVTDNFDVTLALQLSFDRMQFLERLVKYWEGPLSVAIYLSDCEVEQLGSFIREHSDTLSSRTNIGYHLVFKQEQVHYPVNYLRNVALSGVHTPYVFLVDVDFVPMHALHRHLRRALRLVNPYPLKKCLVVPAFETTRYRVSPPRDKAALLARLRSDVAPFRAREWPRGHRATNYSRWITATEPYEVEWQADYEPYLVVHRSVPRYDTRFSGFGWNKVSHSVELYARGYRAVVLPGAFIVHAPHAPSADITAFRARPDYRVCLSILKQEFMSDLKKKYNVTLDNNEEYNPQGKT